MVSRAKYDEIDDVTARAAETVRRTLVEQGYPDDVIATIGFTLIQWVAVTAIREGVDGVNVRLKRMGQGLLLLSDSTPDDVDAVIEALVKAEDVP